MKVLPTIKKWGWLCLWGGVIFSLKIAAHAQSVANPSVPSPQKGMESYDPLGSCSFPKEATTYEKRLQEYQEALQETPHDAELHYHLGILQARLQQWEPAQASFFQALAYGQERAAEVFHQLGNVYACQKKFDHAIAQYKETLRHNPNHEDTRHNLALTQLLAKQEKQNRPANPPPQSSDDESQSEPQSSENPSQSRSHEENSPQENLAQRGASPPSEQNPSEQANPQKKDAPPSQPENNPTAALSRQKAAQQIDAIPENRRKFIQRLIERQNLPVDVSGKNW